MEQWLRSAGLAQHLAAFRENGITLDQLRDLAEDELCELGLSLGERIRFRRALATQPANTAIAPAAAVSPTPRITRAERRPLSVMFVDLVNSSGIGERLDPEDLLETFRLYRAFCGEAIARCDGHVARYLGDGILAYFGYPSAHENDPERAVRAALAITGGIARVATPAAAPLRVRIGIATGRVVLGDVVEGDVAAQVAAVGSVLNLAARLQTLAADDGIVVSEATHARVRARFKCEPIGEVELRGFEDPHQPWRVLRQAAPSHGSGHGGAARKLTAFQGRRAEFQVLRSQWARAIDRDGNLVLVTGEAGIGKSRLVEQFLSQHVGGGATIIRLGAMALDQDSPLRPFLEHVRASARLDDGADNAAALSRLEAALAGDARTRADTARTLAGLLGIALPDPTLGGMPPERLRAETIAALIGQCLLLARRHPLCLVVEDLHWLDPTSLELLETLAGQLGGEPILLILTMRDGAIPAWAEAADAIILKLRPLAPEHVAAILHEVLNAANGSLARDVAARTDGIPLFIEEVARFIVERRRPARPGDGLGGDLHGAIPASLDEALVARLDRAGPAKGIVQIAAVIGRSVPRDILAVVVGEADHLPERLAALVDAGIMLRVRTAGVESYSFSHALLRDAAYASLVREQRQLLHARVAEALARLDPEMVERQPEQLALHLTEGGRAVDAAPHWLEAARRSLARSALQEAARLLQRGLAGLGKLPETPGILDLRVRFSALLGPALLGLRGALAPETQELYRAAYELCRKLPEDPSHFPIYWGWWRLSPDFNAHQERAAALLKRATARQHPELMLQAHHCTWATHLHLGAFDVCCEHMQAGLAIYDQGDYAHHARLYGNHDAKVCAHGALSQLYWMQGKPRAALQEEMQALAWSERLDHLGSRVHALGLTLLHRVYRRDHVRVFEQADKLIACTAEHGVADHAAAGLIFQGWVVASQRDPAAGLRMIEEGFARQRDIATSEDFPVYLCLLAEVLGQLGRPEQAMERIARELAEFDRIGLRMWIPELKRVLADSMLAADAGSADAAGVLFGEAARLAAEQRVPMLSLRIAVSEARLARRRGDARDAGERLRAALAGIVEDDDSPDLADARRALLEAAL